MTELVNVTTRHEIQLATLDPACVASPRTRPAGIRAQAVLPEFPSGSKKHPLLPKLAGLLRRSAAAPHRSVPANLGSLPVLRGFV